MEESVNTIQQTLEQVCAEVGKVIIGQRTVVDQALIAILCGRHALIEGVPGIAKTLLVHTLAYLLGCEFHRIQFTSDLSPSDITGTKLFNPKLNDFTLMQGPVFTTFLLADEINRAPAKVQSALLEAMQEQQVTIDRKTYPLSPNFCVFATQNPIEFSGTYPLSEAQKDRFLMKIHMGPPDEEDELELGRRMLTKKAPEDMLRKGVVRPLLTPEQLTTLRAGLDTIKTPEKIIRYAVALVRMTRNHSAIQVGAGPRATQALLLASRAHAALAGRATVGVEDIKAMTLPCLEHRLILKPDFIQEGLTPPETIQHLLQSVPQPRA